MTFSGGGSRAAYFAAQVLHELDQDTEPAFTSYVDGIFAVSGGSIAAALYGMSGDGTVRGYERPAWSQSNIDRTLSQPLTHAMGWELASPPNFTSYVLGGRTRTDLLESAINAEIFKARDLTLTLGDLNPNRPPIYIISTVATTEGVDAFAPQPFGSLFTFSKRDLIRIGVDPDSVPLAKAIAASAAFPGLLSPVVLPRYRLSTHEGVLGLPRFVHLIDGGNSDNLGLLGAKHALLEDDYRLLRDCDSVVVVSVDAFGKQGFHSDTNEHESSPVGLIFDHRSALASFDALLAANRVRLLGEFKSRTFTPPGSEDLCRKDGLPDEVCNAGVRANWAEINQLLKKKLYFVHLNFNSTEIASQTNVTECQGEYGSKAARCEKMPVDGFRLVCEQRWLRKRLKEIPTKFGLTRNEMNDIKTFVSILNHPKNLCLNHLRDVVAGNMQHDPTFYRSASESCDATEDYKIGEVPVLQHHFRGRLFGDFFFLDETKITEKDRESFDDSCHRAFAPTHDESVKFLLDAKERLIASPRYLVD
jgi:predicted acylesterase/phospholipase RssA